MPQVLEFQVHIQARFFKMTCHLSKQVGITAAYIPPVTFSPEIKKAQTLFKMFELFHYRIFPLLKDS